MKLKYGVLDWDGGHIDVSMCLIAALQFADEKDFEEVVCRLNGSDYINVIYEKIDGMWEFKGTQHGR